MNTPCQVILALSIGAGRWAATVGLAALLSIGPTVSAVSARSVPVHDYDLGSGTHAQVFPDGSVRFRVVAETEETDLLWLAIPWPEDRRAGHREASLFTTVTTEGAEGGHRGFARDADDDNDGDVDEDRRDGRDNDGDGAVDEDFAAISDDMTVVNATRDGRTLHLETYHWSYPHLQRVVMVNATLTTGNGQPVATNAIIEAVASPWERSDLICRARPLARRERPEEISALVCGRPDPIDPTRTIWLGVVLLDAAGARSGRNSRVRRDDQQLAVPFLAGKMRLAISVAPTFLQLTGSLAAAIAVHRGAADPVTGHSVEWIVPPLPPTDQTSPNRAAYWIAEDGGARLEFALQPVTDQLFDPDLFELGQQPLGSPTTIVWYPNEGSRVEIAWQPPTPEMITSRPRQLCDPYATVLSSAGSDEPGRLVFRYAAPTAAQNDRSADSADSDPQLIMARTLDGRSVQLSLDRRSPRADQSTEPGDGYDDSVDAAISATQSDGDDDPPDPRSVSNQPTLNPDLLENYPNPFRDVTNIRFNVPRTVQEGFVWRPDQQPALSPESAIPYRSGYPMVTVSIYSLNGQEIAALFAEQVAPGEYHASWDGSDLHGRPVAAGTYFCKLQVESWSVTKRLVFLR